MDFLTGMAYWGIILLVVINAVVVRKMKISLPGEEKESDKTKRMCPVG